MIAGAAILKKTLTEMKKASERLFQGEITVSKRDCWLVGAILVLTGIALGFIHAPLTHGVNISICSNNGNDNGNNSGNGAGSGRIPMKENMLCKQDAKKESEKTEQQEKTEKGRNRRNKK